MGYKGCDLAPGTGGDLHKMHKEAGGLGISGGRERKRNVSEEG